MPIDYSALLTDEQRRSIIKARLSQFASEAYQHEINKAVAEQTNNEEGVAAALEALAILDTAIAIHQEELSKIPAIE